MNELLLSSAYYGVLISLLAYGIGTAVKKRVRSAVANPLLIAIVLIIAFIKLTGTDYEAYAAGARYLNWLITPATVALAIPLYENVSVLRENKKALAVGIASGVLTSLVTIFALSLLLGLGRELYVTLLPKSITTAIGIDLSVMLGGYGSITAAAIVTTGVLGNLLAEPLCRALRITEPVARGVAIGTASHAIGTAKAMEMGRTEGAVSGLAIVIAGMLTVLGAGVFASFIA